MSDDNCMDAAGRDSPVKLVRCHGMGGNQAWNFSDQVSPYKIWGLLRNWPIIKHLVINS